MGVSIRVSSQPFVLSPLFFHKIQPLILRACHPTLFEIVRRWQNLEDILRRSTLNLSNSRFLLVLRYAKIRIAHTGSSHAHELCFGCDDGATLGHLDVFDLSRSLVDWAPAGGEQRLGWAQCAMWKLPR